MKLLLQRGGDVEQDSLFAASLGRTALHSAAIAGQVGAIALLLEKGANARSRNRVSTGALPEGGHRCVSYITSLCPCPCPSFICRFGLLSKIYLSFIF